MPDANRQQIEPYDRPPEYWHDHREEYFNLMPMDRACIARKYSEDKVIQNFTQEAIGRERTDREWETPIPFETVNLPEFPAESLPGPVAAFVNALAESTQTPRAMAAVLSLGVLSAAFQSRYEAEITTDWKEPLCLYLIAVASPGERKSAVMSALTAPVYEFEEAKREAESAEVAKSRAERDILEKRLERAKKEVAQNKDKETFTEDLEKNAYELAAELENFKVKYPFRLLADDTSTEKLIDIMDAQNGCITVASAEGGIFDTLMGRYDKAASFDIYLKGHAGDPVFVDRIG
jgi:hypothetical protein